MDEDTSCPICDDLMCVVCMRCLEKDGLSAETILLRIKQWCEDVRASWSMKRDPMQYDDGYYDAAKEIKRILEGK